MVASELSATPQYTTGTPRGVLAGEAHLLLEITRGRTRFPLRPVRGPRYLIGAAVTCDLRLGGEGMPALHSLITTEDQVCELEAIAAEPALRVNGQVVQSVRLKDGDVIEIGEVELTARMVAGRTPASIAPMEIAMSDDRPLSELTASELVQRIEAEQYEVDQFEQGRRAGAATLMADLRRLQRQAPEPTRVDSGTTPARGPHFAPVADTGRDLRGATPVRSNGPIDPVQGGELVDLAEQLAALSDELKLSLAGVGEREGEYAQSLTQLLEMQQRLAEQLAEVTESVDRLREQQERSTYEPVRPRVIA
ncbi:MAG: hypothetical protein NT069_27050 [Planctomycetota bacterium]|nr:hypothetical protein [Planctomycetota bacterium]